MERKNGFGARLMRLRGERSQSEIEKAIGVKQRALSYWENEERRLKDTDVVKLAEYYGTTCDYILRGISPQNVDIHKVTGLGDDAIHQLQQYAEHSICDRPTEIETINYLLGSEIGNEIIRYICEYFGLPRNKGTEASIYFDGKTIYAGKPFDEESRLFGAEIIPYINLAEIAENTIMKRLRTNMDMAVSSDFSCDWHNAESKYHDEILRGLEAGRRKRKEASDGEH